jgi:hypothetical protein
MTVSGMARPQGGRHATVFFPFGLPTLHAYGKLNDIVMSRVAAAAPVEAGFAGFHHLYSNFDFLRGLRKRLEYSFLHSDDEVT